MIIESFSTKLRIDVHIKNALMQSGFNSFSLSLKLNFITHINSFTRKQVECFTCNVVFNFLSSNRPFMLYCCQSRDTVVKAIDVTLELFKYLQLFTSREYI